MADRSESELDSFLRLVREVRALGDARRIRWGALEVVFGDRVVEAIDATPRREPIDPALSAATQYLADLREELS